MHIGLKKNWSTAEKGNQQIEFLTAIHLQISIIVVVFNCLSQNYLYTIDALGQNLENSCSGFYDLQPKLFCPQGNPTAELIDMHLIYSIIGRFSILVCESVTFSLTELLFVNLSLSRGFQGL